MTIRLNHVTRKSNDYTQVIKLYKSAFSPDEQLPVSYLLWKAKQKKASFYSCYEDDKWVGFTYLHSYQDITHIFFLAIAETCRAGGYGGKVLNAIKELYPQNRLVLKIEELNEKAENYNQRVKRKKFYEKNDFVSTGIMTKEKNAYYEILSHGGLVTKTELKQTYKEFAGAFFLFLFGPKILDK